MKPARLHKAQVEDPIDQELWISVKTLILLLILVLIFGVFCFLMQPTTYGFF